MSSPCSSSDIIATAVNQELWRLCNEVNKPSHNRMCFLAPVTFTAVHWWQKKPPGMAGSWRRRHRANCHTSATDRTLFTEIRPRVWEGVERGYPVILPICHKCRPFYRCTSCLPRPTLLFLPLLFASKSRQLCCIVAAAHYQLLFDCGLDSGGRQPLTLSEWISVWDFTVKKYRPIPDPP